jgi:hypothetical protein
MENNKENQKQQSVEYFTLDIDTESPTKMIYSIIYLAVALFAIYLSFKCNNGFDLLGFLGAVCYAPIYIIYKLAVGKCF